MREMTPRQREILEFVRTFSDRHGVPPAVREIGERFGFTARAAFDHLRALERKGMLERRVTSKRASRTLVLPGRRSRHRSGGDEIPVLGRIAAGEPILAVENREDTIPLRPEWFGAQGSDVFALRVRGESMVGAHIVDGDLVLVRKQDERKSWRNRRSSDRWRGHGEAIRPRGRRCGAQAGAPDDEAHRRRP